MSLRSSGLRLALHLARARTRSPSAQRPCRSAHASYSRCQTAHPPSLKLRRASKRARHSLGVGGQSSSFPRRARVLPFRFASSAPKRGAAERRRRVTGISVRACEARRLASRATGGRLAALQRGDFRPRDQRFMFRQCPPESAPRLRPRPGITPGRSGLAPPAAAVRSAPWDATSPLSPQGISGDAPHERGCGSIAWMRLVVNIGS